MNKVFQKSQFSRHSIFALLIWLSVAHFASSNDPASKPPTSKVCNRNIVQAYGMTGVEKPIVEKIEMCPKIINSCCLKEDQMIMYLNFIQGGELQNIKDYYKKISDTYQELLETLEKVKSLAVTIKANISKNVANCKMLAERIINYEASEVVAQMKENLTKMEAFMRTSYSGFYCAICNHENHQFFDEPSQTVFFSEKFCRDITQNTLQNLLLFQVDISKHANLVNRFVTSCDFMGQYNLNAIPPSNLAITVNNDIMQDLQSCRDNRNKREWFSYCKEICRNFHLTTYPAYFEPNIEVIQSFTTYVKSQLDITTKFPSSQRQLINTQSPPKSGSRVLEDSGDIKDQKEHKRVLEETKTKMAFKPGISAKLSLATFKSDFLSSGISLYDEGQSQLIQEDTYQSVKSFMDAKKSIDKNKKNRKLGLGSSVGIWRFSSMMALTVLFLVKRG